MEIFLANNTKNCLVAFFILNICGLQSSQEITAYSTVVDVYSEPMIGLSILFKVLKQGAAA